MITVLIASGFNKHEVAKVFECDERSVRNIAREKIELAKRQRLIHEKIIETLEQ